MTKQILRSIQWQGMWQSFTLYTAVVIGTAIGGTGRALVSVAAAAYGPPDFPWGTLAVNVLGSLFIGVFATLTDADGRLFVSTRTRQFVMTGICGGFTTFSVFSLETIRFLQTQNFTMAGINLGLSVTTWMIAVWAGHAIAARINRIGGP